jgi:hypothetical protein
MSPLASLTPPHELKSAAKYNENVRTSLVLTILMTIGAAGCASRLVPEPSIATLGAPDADNTGVSLASNGHRAVAAWAATRDGHTDIYSATSEDDGVTFGEAVRVNDIEGDARVSGEQPPRVALGREVVVVWASRAGQSSRIRMARSTDGGHTYQPAVTLHQESLPGARGWQSVAVGSDDVVHALWLDGRNADPSAAHHHDHAAAGAPMAASESGSPRQDIVEAVWTPQGATETQVAPNVCFCCKTTIAMGPDHAFYAAWRHIYPNSMRDIAVARSIDNGQTFGPPTRVSLDNWQLNGCPDDGPAMVIDASDVIHIAWPTLVPGPTAQKGVFYAYSTDHGQTFSARLRIDDLQGTVASHPAIVLDGGDVVVAWDDLSPAKERRVRLRRLSSSGSGAAWRPTVDDAILASERGPSSYPSLVVAGDKILVAWTSEGEAHTDIRIRRFSR